MRGIIKEAKNVLEVKENDNWFMAYNKGAAKGYIVGVTACGLFVGALKLAGKLMNRNDEVEVFEEEMGAE